jgi:TPR repeat protein
LLGRENLTDEETDTKHVRLVEAAAVQGHAKAQFAMGQFHDRGGDLLPYDAEKSAEWFRLSAEQGYPYAKWVHGMNLLHGLGVPADERLALEFIKQAAEGKFEEALKYMTDAYAKGRHGLPVDKQQAACWREKLQEPGVTGL